MTKPEVQEFIVWRRHLRNPFFQIPVLQYITSIITCIYLTNELLNLILLSNATMKTSAKIFLLIIMLIKAYHACATKTGDVSGQVIDKETMTPVAFATVILEGNSNTIVIAANEYGYYSV